MPASQRPPYWEQAESKASSNDIQEYLSVYSECTTVYTSPSTSSKSSRMKLYNTKSAIWSFMKGDIYKHHHPTFTQDRYFNAMMKR